MNVELEFDKKCKVRLSPKTVLPLHPKSFSNLKESSKQRRDQSLVEEDCRDIRVKSNMSASCRSIHSRLSVVDDPVELRRGSVYQDSREVRKMKGISSGLSRSKIEISRISETKNAESLCDLGHEGSKQGSFRDLPVHPALIRVSASKADEEACSSKGFIEISLDMNDRRKVYSKGLDEGLSYLVDEVISPANDANILLEEDETQADVREKLETPHTNSNRQPVDTPKSLASTKSSRFSPIKKMMDPFLKSQPCKSSLRFESGGHNNEALPNPLPHRVLDMREHFSGAQDSPALLHACLTLRTKSETPMFEFKTKCPDVSFLARIWKRNMNAGDWVYTFHSVNARKRWDFSRWGSKDDCKELPIIGQMQVSSRLCPESNGIADKLMVTEFVLHDLANASQGKSFHDSSDDVPDISHLQKIQEGTLDDIDLSDDYNLKQGLYAYPADITYPYEPAILRPDMETVAIILQIPLEKRESLEFKKTVVKASDKSLLDENIPEVVVVTPYGSHSLPDAENQGPSSLLDRWRHGDGCECGGWDMGCPLNVFSNPVTKKAETTDHFELHLQGKKEKTPALSIKLTEEGTYEVAFHARLSALQAFSVSVAMLHGSVASSTKMCKNTELTTHCSSLKLLIEHELERLIEAFITEDTKTIKPSTKESHLSSVNPTFSPMSRV